MYSTNGDKQLLLFQCFLVIRCATTIFALLSPCHPKLHKGPPSAIYIFVPLSLMQRWLMTWTSNLTATRRVVMGAGMGQHPRSDKTRPHTVNELPLSRGWRLADLSNDWSHTYKVQCSINWWAAQIKKKSLRPCFINQGISFNLHGKRSTQCGCESKTQFIFILNSYGLKEGTVVLCNLYHRSLYLSLSY